MSRLVRAASSISLMTLGSRVLGLWRDSVMAAVFGAGRVSDTFLLAWAFPNMMRRLLGEGALSASFVPAYARTLRSVGEPAANHDGEAAARELLAAVLGTMLVLLLPLLLIVPAIVLLLSLGSGNPLLPQLSTILFPYTVPICLAAMLSGALNTRGSFALPASIPILLNIVWIAALYIAPLCGIESEETLAHFLAWALLLGGILQLALVATPLWLAGSLARPRLGWPARGTAARAVFVTMVPTVIGMSLGQVSSLIDQGMAYVLLPDGANSYLYYANRLLLFPHALTALAVVTAVFPRLADEGGEVGRTRMRGTLDRAAAATLFVTVPASVGLMLVANDLIAVLFERHSFGAIDTAATALTTQFLVAGLPFMGLAQLYARAFYSVADTRTPAIMAGVLLFVGVGLNLLMILGFGLGTEALAAATSLGGLLNATLLSRMLRRHAPAGTEGILPAAWLRSLLATGLMAVAVWAARTDAQVSTTGDRLLWRIAIPITVGMATYGLVQLLLKSPELRSLRRRK